MKPACTLIALVLSFLGCASQSGAAFAATPTGGERPAWQQQMERARRLAAEGYNYVLMVRPVEQAASATSGVWVFYNNPDPFCYTYMIPGEWVGAREPNAYRSRDGRAFAGVLFWLPADLEGLEGATLAERGRTFITREHEKALGQRLPDVEFLPFESARAGTWKWTAGPLTQQKLRIALPTKIIVDLSPSAVVQITVQGTADDDGVARRIVESLRTTSEPECYWQLLENMLKSAFQDR